MLVVFVKSLSLLALSTLASAATLSNSDFRVNIDDTTGALLELYDGSANSSMSKVSGPRNAPWQPTGSRWGLGFSDLGEDLLHRSYWIDPQTSSRDEASHTSTYISGPLELVVERMFNEGALLKRSTFIHRGNETLNIASRGEQSLGIYTPFNDHYTNTTDALHSRSHAHVWANGGATGWVKMDQMGGYERNLGLVVTKEALAGYSIEGRDPITLSNTRGVFFLHSVIKTLQPGDSDSIEWSLSWHDDWEDFFTQCAAHSSQFIRFQSPDYTLVLGEEVTIRMSGAGDQGSSMNGLPITCNHSKSAKFPCEAVVKPTKLGENAFTITAYGGESKIFLDTTPAIDSLIDSRANYILERQQLPNNGNVTDGAYAVFDLQAQVPALWETLSDKSLGRERLGMGIMMSRWLRKNPGDDAVRLSLERFYSFASLHLQDDTGYVLNRPGSQSTDNKRLYNWPWMLQLHISVAAAHRQGHLNLHGAVADKAPVEKFMLTLENFYAEGGEELYAIGLPILEGLRFLSDEGLDEYHDCTLSLFLRHGEKILQRGLDYPPFKSTLSSPSWHLQLSC